MCGATRFTICLVVIILIAHLLRRYPHLVHLIPFRSICILSVNSKPNSAGQLMFLLKTESDIK